jgi:hypothetical protein
MKTAGELTHWGTPSQSSYLHVGVGQPREQKQKENQYVEIIGFMLNNRAFLYRRYLSGGRQAELSFNRTAL